ncbi:hypothetical protein SAMN02910265_03215 [Ruminococcus flavefaciens]|uniref:Uncharacterized protein n=1 Tax=Ruminococcus flavefaciens TaxID=1265 RepID=A0A1H6LKI8_RUMFL|nr:hypothetical protein [Ruminococcus flavefaciens]SEH89012.1 hypothetical protein SAMN02910265_03215 [Ruminococcus flavefaciens]
MDFAFKAFANCPVDQGNNQSSDVSFVGIPSQQVSWPTSQCFVVEKDERQRTPIGVMDKIFSGEAWLEPKTFLENYSKRDLSPRRIFQDKLSCMWKFKE